MKNALDIESRATGDDHLSVRLWLRLLACTNLIEARISSGLREQFGTTLPRFDFLSQLERSPKGLRMTEISERMMVTGGNVTRIAADLEADGLIVRTPQPGDRRALIVTLTAAGRRAFSEMAEVHESWIIEILSGLRSAERTQLFSQLATLKRRLNEPRNPFR
jgi:DNA-binding MarR family transcriptional regulator